MVLDSVAGRPIQEADLHRVFYTPRFSRTLDIRGYARFRHWKIYGERGLAQRPVGVWLYGPQLLIEHREEPLAEFRVANEPGRRRLKAVTLHRLFATPFRSPQPLLFPLDDAQWLKALRAAAYTPRRPRLSTPRQLPLFSNELLNTLLA